MNFVSPVELPPLRTSQRNRFGRRTPKVTRRFRGGKKRFGVGPTATHAAAELKPRIALALSGGGFRAALFHIGVVRRSAELGWLHHVDLLSTVSGGSIIGAFMALRWQELIRRNGDGAAFEQCIAQPFIEIVSQRNFIRAWAIRLPIVLAKKVADRSYTRTEAAAELLGRWFFNEQTCAELPERPYLVVNATTLLTMRSWPFCDATHLLFGQRNRLSMVFSRLGGLNDYARLQHGRFNGIPIVRIVRDLSGPRPPRHLPRPCALWQRRHGAFHHRDLLGKRHPALCRDEARPRHDDQCAPAGRPRQPLEQHPESAATFASSPTCSTAATRPQPWHAAWPSSRIGR